MSLAIVVLAAGKGTRMNSDLPKVLHPLLGRPMIDYVIETALCLSPKQMVVIVGHDAERVSGAIQKAFPSSGITFALQSPQLGTGHAVRQSEALLKGHSQDVLVLSGDTPLARPETYTALLRLHQDDNADATLLTATLSNPFGYGRIIRSSDGKKVVKVVEQKDATPEEAAITEVNSGIYVFKNTLLFDALSQITNHNAQGEYYLPDVLGRFAQEGRAIAAQTAKEFDDIRGINTPVQLRDAEAILRARRAL